MQGFYGRLAETAEGTRIFGEFRCSRIQQVITGLYFAFGLAALIAVLYDRNTLSIVWAALYLALGAALCIIFRAVGRRSKDRLMEFIQDYLLN